MYDRFRAEFHQGSQQQHQFIDSLEEDAAGAGTIQRALVPRYDTAAMYIGILEKHRLFTPLPFQSAQRRLRPDFFGLLRNQGPDYG